ncbi:flagellar hook-associated protein 2 [Paucisalibacillus sp. EB02]|uniref:flagellar hook-associated protein 2 n=1 Tax=Paucisalibacillus sp. EB02 TaxID=1347087 RepID=UPI0004B50445|nr:flagellar hook-associated protein 2 [Paucisalibacillus sp. EB02]
MVMRIGGLASGINTDEIIQKLMTAERMPLDRMEQNRTLLEWQRDGYREIYQKLYEMDTKLILDMKKSSTYNSKSVSSSNESAVTATASSSAQNGSYNIEVTNLASSAIKVGGEISFNPNTPLNELDVPVEPGIVTFQTYDVEKGEMVKHEVSIDAGDSLNDILKEINNDKSNNVRAFYDEQSKKVIFETTRTGNYNGQGDEIIFDSDFFNTTLNFNGVTETGGTDAAFKYNGVDFTSKSNTYSLGGVTFEFKNVTETGKKVSLTVDNNVDAAFDSIMKFVDKYNEIVDLVNKSQTEERYRDYKPLTEKQKEEMEDKQVELWEAKAKSGILRGDSILTSGLFDLRQTWYSSVDTGGEVTTLTQIGISTTADYMNGGKLKIDEGKLKEALRENPDEVYKLFSNNTEDKSDPSRGLINKLEDSVESMMKRIEERAGKTTSSLDNYTLGKRIKDLDTRMSDFEDRLLRVESRYWNQFNAMEQAISRLNAQSAQLFSQFGGGM